MAEKQKVLSMAIQELQRIAKTVEFETLYDCKIELQPLYYSSGKIEYSPQIIFGGYESWKIFYISDKGNWDWVRYAEYNDVENWNKIILAYFESKEKALQVAFDFLSNSKIK